jgi:UDP-glucose 4-epimerase
VEALLRVAVSEKTVGEVYNLGSGKPVSVKQAAQGVIEAVGQGLFKSIAYPSDKKAIEIGDYYADFQKIQRAVDWEPTVTLSDGLKRTVAFYRQFKKHYW